MKKYTTALIAIVLCISSFGYSHSFAAAPSSSQASKKAAIPSLYHVVPKFKAKVMGDQLIWTGNQVTVTANRIRHEEAMPREQYEITSLVVRSGERTFTLPTEQREDALRDVASVSLSPSHDFLAIHLERSAGYSLLLVNLKTGSFTDINERLIAAGKGNIELVGPYNWSPQGDQLAFAFGDTSKSSLAIYNTAKDSLLYLPRETNYISTALILWHKHGEALDYISEGPSDRLVWFRYSLGTNKVKPMKRLEHSELSSWLSVEKI